MLATLLNEYGTVWWMMSGELMEPMDELPLKELGDERIGEIGAGVKQLEFILESTGSIGLLEGTIWYS